MKAHTPLLRRILSLALLLSLGLGGASCSKPHAHSDGDGHSHDHKHAHGHEHVAPHGGTAIELGDEQFHLELVRDAETGTLTAYVLDGHLENFIRSDLPRIQIVVTSPLQATLDLLPVANAATGETVGQTSQFETKADWLKTTEAFVGEIPAITVKGNTFAKVAFRFPQGNH